MYKKFIYFLLTIFIVHSVHSFDLVTSIDDISDFKALSDLSETLQKNINHLLINKIHIFYKKSRVQLPETFKHIKINLIPTENNPYFDALLQYANEALDGRKVIIARPNVFFDDTLFKINYYPFKNQLFCLSDDYEYNCWIFEAPLLLKIPKQIKFNDRNIDSIILESLNNNDIIHASNPALDIFAYQHNKKQKSKDVSLPATKLKPFSLDWDLVSKSSRILLYAKNMHCSNPSYCTPAENPNCYKFACLSHNKSNSTHMIFDITQKLPLPDNSVDVYLAEDVFEHIEYNSLVEVINEIYRVLKPGGFCRISMPDYRCDILQDRSTKDKNGKIVFDPMGGGQFVDGKVINGGHLWFPVFETTQALLKKTKFFTYGKINFLHYYDLHSKSITKPIDYSICYVRRTPDNDGRVKNPYRVMSIVVDLFKQNTTASILTALWPFKAGANE